MKFEFYVNSDEQYRSTAAFCFLLAYITQAVQMTYIVYYVTFISQVNKLLKYKMFTYLIET